MSSNRPYLNEVYKKQQGILFQYFVERDYSTGTCPKFQKTFPRVLRSRVSALLAYEVSLLNNNHFFFVSD